MPWRRCTAQPVPIVADEPAVIPTSGSKVSPHRTSTNSGATPHVGRDECEYAGLAGADLLTAARRRHGSQTTEMPGRTVVDT
ncbi:MAG: hypothetical protein LC799_09675 [Actinobacteria bacterium]|nr:hypothetical protein [Actinomycetota bacterium]